MSYIVKNLKVYIETKTDRGKETGRDFLDNYVSPLLLDIISLEKK